MPIGYLQLQVDKISDKKLSPFGFRINEKGEISVIGEKDSKEYRTSKKASNNPNYPNDITQQSQAKFNRLKEKMLEPIKQIQQSRQQNLKNLLSEIDKKQSLLQEKKASLEKLFYNDEKTTKQEQEQLRELEKIMRES
ncbi:39497_t:CDS:2 [Gigaspora margarita]|uniref:39497_t:CDS:1 n=1 Tax=Gigaspora margarita TaxID=4874 RepID=A0ABM8VWC8_GIGMA|nr:39497_t:CDS:2 [Gigaspora margarita]